MKNNVIYCGDCLQVLKTLPDNSIDSIVTDPPYGLEFMGEDWDKFKNGKNIAGGTIKDKSKLYGRLCGKAPAFFQLSQKEKISYQQFCFAWASECLRVLKPGGFLLSFGGTRTYHRLACAIEDAGFEIRDMIEWVYGSGFPKSTHIGKMLDKKMGNKRRVISIRTAHDIRGGALMEAIVPELKKENSTMAYENTEGDSEWEGWGTGLKPAHEPICLARKPVSEKSVVDNVLKWGTGGLNIDACRINTGEKIETGRNRAKSKSLFQSSNIVGKQRVFQNKGRWPANFIHDGSQEVLSLFPYTCSGEGHFNKDDYKQGTGVTGFTRGDYNGYGDEGSAARFFYCAKANSEERSAGLSGEKNTHPTVKPVALVRYLVRLVTPKGGIVLDPFIGSGTTGIAALLEGVFYIGIEQDPDYARIAEKRLQAFKNSILKEEK